MAKRKAASPNIINTADDRVLTERELLERLPLDRSTVWRMVQDGRFPRPIQLSPGRKGWRWSVIAAWLADREAQPIKRRRYFRERANAEAS